MTIGPGTNKQHVGGSADRRRTRVTGNLMRRLATVATAALLGTMLLGTATVSASTPGWTFSHVDTSLNPGTVGTGYNAAFVVTLDNAGSSNISAVFISTDIPKTASNVSPTFIGVPTWHDLNGNDVASQPYTCDAVGSGPLNCSFGSLAAGRGITILVVFTAPAPGTASGLSSPASCARVVDEAAWTFHFTAFGNGNTPTDKGGKSHGDTLCGDASVTTSSDSNYAGGYTLDTGAIATTGTLGNGNKQTTTLFPPATAIAATVEDGLADSTFSCLIVACDHRFGEWSRLGVNGGATYTGGFKIVLLIYGGAVPGPAKTTNINLIHNEGTTTYVISQRCDGVTTLDAVAGGAECITVTMAGRNFKIEAWLNHNGGGRGTYS
jgi:hypothetical protein